MKNLFDNPKVNSLIGTRLAQYVRVVYGGGPVNFSSGKDIGKCIWAGFTHHLIDTDEALAAWQLVPVGKVSRLCDPLPDEWHSGTDIWGAMSRMTGTVVTPADCIRYIEDFLRRWNEEASERREMERMTEGDPTFAKLLKEYVDAEYVVAHGALSYEPPAKMRKPEAEALRLKKQVLGYVAGLNDQIDKLVDDAQEEAGRSLRA